VDRIRRAAHAVSVFFSGLVGIVAFVGLAFLGVIGTILTAFDLLNVTVDPGLLFFPAAMIVAGNLVFRERQNRQQAEVERDAAKAALDAKPDEAAVLRTFLRLHDYGPRVLGPFHATIEKRPKTMPIGEKVYEEWIARCTDAITEYRPAFALAFRQAQAINLANYRSGFVIVKDDEGKDVYVDLDESRRYDDLVAQAMKVLADIIRAG
jgi:hypothetical protein